MWAFHLQKCMMETPELINQEPMAARSVSFDLYRFWEIDILPTSGKQ